VTLNSKEENPLKTFVPITFKNSGSVLRFLNCSHGSHSVKFLKRGGRWRSPISKTSNSIL
jgi:hypothetical protein